MDALSTGFWGVFFGTAMLMLGGSAIAYVRTRHKVPLRAALVGALSALFAVAYLGGLPIADRETEDRVLALVAVVSFALLGLLLLALLGMTRTPPQRQAAAVLVGGLAMLVVLVGWALSARQALVLSSAVAILVGLAALAITGRSALRGDRLAWVALAGVFFVNVAMVALTWINLHDVRGWPLHAAGALAGSAYLSAFSVAVWSRYSYLIELRRVMAYGPSYDPITRMRSHEETGELVRAMFRQGEGTQRSVGVVAISIGNLYAIEKLHGRGAANHALFVCATRLRRAVPAGVEMGRLGGDGFLLLVRKSDDPRRLIALARQLVRKLAQPVSLSISDPSADEASRAIWVADVGLGVLAAATPARRPAEAVAMARAMSRTAWSYASRIAWFDRDKREIAELRLVDGAP